LQEREPISPAERSEVFWSWVASISFHAVVGTLVVLILVFWARKSSGVDRTTIIIPNSFDDPAYSEHPGGTLNPGAGDPMRDAAQGLKQLAKSEGWSESKGQDLSQLTGNSAENDAVGIFAGSGASVGTGKDGNASGASMAAYGTPGGGFGSGPRSSFYGTGGNATRIVYILDCSGSMLDNFDFLKKQAQKSINNLVPLQGVAVIMVSDKATALGSGSLQRADSETKKQLTEEVAKQIAEGANDNLLTPFHNAFNRAFSMKPELIYFLTDGKFGDGLLGKVNQLNRDKKVHINTIAFVTEEPAYKQQLEQLAKENGGSYKFIREADVSK